MPDKRKSDLAKIHIARQQLGMKDVFYRSMLRRLCDGKTSAADLTAVERERVIDHFITLGWRPKPGTHKAPHGATAQRRKIKVLIDQCEKSHAYAQAICKRMYRCRLEHASAMQLRGVTAALVRNKEMSG